MKYLGILIVGFLALCLASEGPLQAYTYGPACQWFRLRGKVEIPPEAARSGPPTLTVTYQLPNQKVPATLLTNYPVGKEEYFFVLSGFSQDIDGAIFVSPGFLFSKEIVFRYYAKTKGGKWVSETKTRVFKPPLIPRVSIPKNAHREFRCDTDIEFETLALRPHPSF